MDVKELSSSPRHSLQPLPIQLTSFVCTIHRSSVTSSRYLQFAACLKLPHLYGAIYLSILCSRFAKGHKKYGCGVGRGVGRGEKGYIYFFLSTTILCAATVSVDFFVVAYFLAKLWLFPPRLVLAWSLMLCAANVNAMARWWMWSCVCNCFIGSFSPSALRSCECFMVLAN